MEGTSHAGPLTQLDANIMAAILVHLEPADLIQVRPTLALTSHPPPPVVCLTGLGGYY
jgi:hypothetical protein